jgi:glucokinase
MILGGDLGGTKTLLGLFERGEPRPRPIVSHAYPTHDFDSFTAILDAFARDIGTPSPWMRQPSASRARSSISTRRLTNIQWNVSVAEIAGVCRRRASDC